MKLAFSLSGSELRCVAQGTPLGRRYLLPYQAERVSELGSEMLGALERANRARTLSEAGLSTIRQAGEELSRLLLPPELATRLRASMGSLSLTIDAELASIPWELLYDGEQFLCRRFDLGRRLVTDWPAMPSVFRPTELQPPLRMLVICADSRGDLDRLEQECTGLLQALDGDPERIKVRLLRAQDLDSVRRALKSYDIVHFAGHADYDPADPGGAGWQLGDGKLTAEEIATLGLARPMPLMVFSNACQSGLMGPWSPDKQARVLGLSGAFLQSGTRFYIGTQWELVDGIGARVASHFYDALLRGGNVGAALRAARMQVLEEEGEASLGWASYVLYGDPGYVPLPASYPTGPGGAPASQDATGRLGMRATLRWKRRRGKTNPTLPGINTPDELDPPAAWPPWLVAGIMVLFLLGAASLGAWLFSLLSGR